MQERLVELFKHARELTDSAKEEFVASLSDQDRDLGETLAALLSSDESSLESRTRTKSSSDATPELLDGKDVADVNAASGEVATTGRGDPQQHEYDVGILFVHGIGEQFRGDTLLRFAGPIVDWLKRWAEQQEGFLFWWSARGSFRVTESVLAQERLQDEPAHICVTIDPGSGETKDISNNETSWTLAESWWGADLTPPSFRRMAAWMLTAGPWTIISHAERAVRRTRLAWRPVARVCYSVFSILVAILVQLVVAALAVLAVAPIPPLRRALSAVLLRLSSTIGDAYVYVTSPLQREAGVSRIRDDLAWLDSRCKTTIVVAHSQGAAMAHRALQHPSVNIDGLITLGSGLNKLDALQFVQQSAMTQSKITMPLLIVTVLLSNSIITEFGWIGVLPVVVLTVSCMAILWSWLSDIRKGYDKISEERSSRLSFESIHPLLVWTDYYATNDPVSNGPIDAEATIPGVQSSSVTNLRSAFRDHSSYWDNRDEFVASVVRDIDTLAKTQLFNQRDATRLERARDNRRSRVLVLTALRWAAVFSALLAALCLGRALPSIGRELVYLPMAKTKLLSPLADVLQSLGSLVHSAVLFVTGYTLPTSAIGLGTLGVVLPIGVFWCWHLITKSMWRIWDRDETEQLFANSWFYFRFFYWLPCVLVGAIPVLFAGYLSIRHGLDLTWSVFVESMSSWARGIVALAAGLFGAFWVWDFVKRGFRRAARWLEG